MNNEPIAWMHQNPDYPISKHSSLEYNIPLYTHPAKTLTDEEILKVWHETPTNEYNSTLQRVCDFAKAILRKAQD